jgi:Glyoxalase-like domain
LFGCHKKGEVVAAYGFQVVIDCRDPRALSQFWAEALGYVAEPPPRGYDTWEAFLDAMNVPADKRNAFNAVVDPAGKGPRVFFQQVPEPKEVKNRVHLDIIVSRGAEDPWAAVLAHVAKLERLGATRGAERSELGARWINCQDPEGNEFDVA